VALSRQRVETSRAVSPYDTDFATDTVRKRYIKDPPSLGLQLEDAPINGTFPHSEYYEYDIAATTEVEDIHTDEELDSDATESVASDIQIENDHDRPRELALRYREVRAAWEVDHRDTAELRERQGEYVHLNVNRYFVADE
jgi:hypothetical protein